MFDDIVKILLNHTTLNKEQILMDSKLMADLGLNSCDVVTIACEFEDYFNIEIPDDDISSFWTVGDIYNYLNTKI